LRCLGHRAAEKVAEFDQLGFAGRPLRQAIEGLVYGESFKRVPSVSLGQIVEIRMLSTRASAAFATLLSASVFDDNAAHCLGGRGKEVTAMVPATFCLVTDESQVRLVHKGGRLKRLPRLFMGQSLRCEPAQLVVDEGQKLLGGVRIAVFDRRKDTGDVVH
jgi:hypothetical protein